MSPFRPGHLETSKPPLGGFLFLYCLAGSEETVYKRDSYQEAI
jgi:hypothetical protein